jgi:hypothetical protein
VPIFLGILQALGRLERVQARTGFAKIAAQAGPSCDERRRPVGAYQGTPFAASCNSVSTAA